MNAISLADRWEDVGPTPEPVPIRVVGPQGQQLQIFDYSRFTLETRVDVHPGESELLDVAVRFDDDLECYGWNNEAFFSHPIWRNRKWKLGPGRYLVTVVVRSSGQNAPTISCS